MSYKALLFITVLYFSALHVFAQATKRLMSVSGPGNEMIVGMAIDKNDNITMTGYVYGNSLLNNSVLLQSKDSEDVFVSRCDKFGNVLWNNVFGGKDINSPNAITVDHEGYTYVSGYFRNDFYADGQLFSGPWRGRYFFTRLDNKGKITWVKTFAAPDELYVWQHSLYCDKDDNIYLTLMFYDSIKVGGVSYYTNHTRGDILIKYKPDGTLQWAKVLEEYGNGFTKGAILGISDDEEGHLFMCGTLTGSPAKWGGKDFPGLKPGHDRSTCAYIARLDKQSGNLQWVKYGESRGATALEIIRQGTSGSFYVAGYFTDTLTIDSLKIGEYMYDHFIPVLLCMDTSGKVLWSKMMSAYIDDLCVDNKGYLYIGGECDGGLYQDNISFLSLYRDAYILRCDSTGNITSACHSKVQNSYSEAYLWNLACNSDNRVYASGWTDGVTAFWDTVLTSKYTAGYIWALPSDFSFASVDELPDPQQNITIYPNPISGNNVTIRLSNLVEGEIMISCFDAMGRSVYSTTVRGNSVQEYHLQLPSLSTGVYLLKVTSGNHNYLGRILKRE